MKRFKLSKYMIPSIISMVVVGTNANVDGLFIGRILGDDGLAAINIAWPIVACIASLGTGLGIGGSVIFNRIRGEGKVEYAEAIKNSVLLLLTVLGIIVGLIFTVGSKPLLKLMGAEAEVLVYALNYVMVISIGAVFQVVSAGLLVLLRNDHKPYHSMVYALIGLVLHIILDFVLAKRFVMAGVAASTVISQAVVMVLGFVTLKIDRSNGLSTEHISKIVKGAAAPFGINFVPSLVLLFTNFFALKYGGIAGVSAYAVMSYAVYTFDYVFQGICDGIQPIISYCRGAKEQAEERRALKSAVIVLVVFSVFCILLTPLLIQVMPRILAASDDAGQLISRGFWIYAASYPFKAAVKFICSYHYAAEKELLANILVYLDPLILTPVSLFVSALILGIDGVWMAMPVSQILLTLICVFLSIYEVKVQGKEKNDERF